MSVPTRALSLGRDSTVLDRDLWGWVHGDVPITCLPCPCRVDNQNLLPGCLLAPCPGSDLPGAELEGDPNPASSIRRGGAGQGPHQQTRGSQVTPTLLRAQPDHGHTLPCAAPGSGVHEFLATFCYPELQQHPEGPHLPSALRAAAWVYLPSGKGQKLPRPPPGHPRQGGQALGGPSVPQAWGLFLATSYYAIRVPIFSVALLDGGGFGGQATPPATPLLRCLQGSPWPQNSLSRLFIQFSLGFFFFNNLTCFPVLEEYLNVGVWWVGTWDTHCPAPSALLPCLIGLSQ